MNYFRHKKANETITEIFLSLLSDEAKNNSDILDYACDKSINTFIQTNLMLPNDPFEMRLRDKLFSIDDMLLSCFYNQQPCTKADFKPYYSGAYGLCYTFNSGYDQNLKPIAVHSSVKPGELNGLQVELFVGSPENLPCWVTTNGVIVSVHNKSAFPLVAEEGIKLVTGKETNLVVDRTYVTRKSSPYGDCVDDFTPNGTTKFSRSPFFRATLLKLSSYSQNHCISDCASDLGDRFNVSSCIDDGNMTVSEMRNCLIKATNFEPFYPLCFSSCPMECRESLLTVTPHLANYPTNAYAISMSKNIENFTERFLSAYDLLALRLNKTINVSISYETIKNSILAFNVYYDAMMFTQIEEVPAITFGDVLASKLLLLFFFNQLIKFHSISNTTIYII